MKPICGLRLLENTWNWLKLVWLKAEIIIVEIRSNIIPMRLIFVTPGGRLRIEPRWCLNTNLEACQMGRNVGTC